MSGQRKDHALSFNVICDEFNVERCSFENVEVQSRAFLRRVVAQDFVFSAPIDPIQLDEAVSALIVQQNLEGFSITGWFRPAKDDVDIVRDAQILHIVRIDFDGCETEEKEAMRFNNFESGNTCADLDAPEK